MDNYILNNYNPNILIKNLGLISKIYNKYGVVIFKSFFNKNLLFENYIKDLSTIFEIILKKNKIRHGGGPNSLDLGEKLSLLSKVCPLDGRIIANLGTQNNKFNSFNLIKYSDFVHKVLIFIFGKKAIIATPSAGDTLHFFPPSEKFHKYNLPPHQDYQYLMQSPRQITFYMGLSDFKEGVGGLRIWLSSHKIGIDISKKNKNGHWEIQDFKKKLKNYEVVDYNWTTGDFGLFNSLICHSSIPNMSSNSSRIVQLFRFSDLNDETAKSFNWMSSVYERAGVRFEDVYKKNLN
jgi:hypothetical protein